MAKQSKRGASRGRHLHSVPSTPAPPRELVVAGQVLDSFTPDFVRWFEQSYGEPELAMDFLAAVKALMAASLEFTGTCSATVFPPATVSVILEETDQWGDDEAVQGLTGCLHVYLGFLIETGRWSGSAEEFEEAHDLLATWIEDQEPGELPIELPELGEDEELEAFTGLELIRRTTALLTWLGPGKAVTSTGALRLKDIAPAAETVGVEVRAQWNAKRPLQPLPGFETPEFLQEQADPVVRSMHEVAILKTVWPALREAGIITIGSTTARPAEAAQHWLHGTPAQRIEAYRRFAAQFLGAAVDTAASSGNVLWQAVGDQVAELLGGVLVAGCTPSPVPRQKLEALTTGEEEPGDLMTGLVLRRVRAALEELTELGLLEQGEQYRVPPVVVGCAAAAFGPAEGTAVEPAAYQLKIALRGAKPPIWRRVVVPSTTRLDELHRIIQVVFGWEGYHLHQFSTGNGYSGTRYAPPQPPGPLGGFGEDDSIDESTVALGALLEHVGDRLTYLYDFGDDWFHDVVLEKVGDLDPAEPLPRCTGGRGMAPTEDCGGVWGWAGLVEAVGDPGHPEHENLREWLGLRPGENLDPKAFAVAEADAALDDLR